MSLSCHCRLTSFARGALQTFRRLRPPRVSEARLEGDLCAGVGGSYLPRRPPGYPLLSCSRSGRSGCEGSQAPRPGLAGATANCLEGFNHFPFPSWQLRLENDLREASTISVSVRSTLLAKRGCIHKRNPADTKQQPVPPSPRRGSSTAPHQVPRPGAAPIARHDGQGFQATILCGALGAGCAGNIFSALGVQPTQRLGEGGVASSAPPPLDRASALGVGLSYLTAWRRGYPT